MELIGTIKTIQTITPKGFAVFTLKLDDELESEMPIDAFPAYGEKEIKVIGFIGNGIELLEEYKVKIIGKFKECNKQYQNDYSPKMDFNINPGELDIVNSINSFGGLLSYVTRYVSGVGEIQAKNLINHFGIDNFIKEMDKKDIEKELITISGIGEIKAKMIKESWDENKVERDIMLELSSLGLSINKCNLIFKNWGSSYKDKLKEDPYQLTEIRGIGFKLADEVARNFLHMDKKDDRRYAGIVEFLVREKSSESGDSLIGKQIILEGIKEFIANDNEFKSNDINTIFETGIKKAIEKESIIEINKDTYVLRKYFFYEYKIASKIKELAEFDYKTTKFDKAIEREKIKFKNKEKGALNEAQLQAKEVILNSKISILVGGAGTGKTYTVGSIIDTLNEVGEDYFIVTPTNKAAARVKEVNPNAKVSTIHSLLGIIPGEAPMYNEEYPLPYTRILVDETSMLDNNIGSILLSAIDVSKTSIVFIGDSQQLPPVGVGSFFYDLINSGFISDTTNYLSVVERTGEGKYEELLEAGKKIKIVKEGIHNIVANSLNILDKKLPVHTGYDCINLFSNDNYTKNTLTDDIRQKIVELYNTLQKNNVDVNKDFQIYIPQYGTDVGINAINNFISNLINTNDKQEIPDTGKEFKLNDKVVYNNTNKELGLTKGDTGYIKDISPITKSIIVHFYSHNRDIELGKGILDDISLGYALTVHKTQGTEVKYGAIILTTSFYLLLTNELLYTAYTRCKEKVYLLGQEKAYKTALRTHIKQRNTYLYHLLLGTPKNEIFPNVNRRTFGVTDSELKQVKDFLGQEFKLNNPKLIKVSYSYGTIMNYYRYIIANKSILSENNLMEDIEITSEKLDEILYNKDIFFIKIKKIVSKEELNKSRKYKKNTDSNINTSVIEINSFDKDIKLY